MGISLLYKKYGGVIYGVALKIVRDEQWAQQVLQDTYVKVWQKISLYSERKGRFLSWILSITRNLAIDFLRSKQYKEGSGWLTLQESDKETAPDRSMEAMDLKKSVVGLGHNYRQVIELVYFMGYSHSEVADLLEMPLGTVKTRVRKALRDLRRKLVDD